MVSKRGAVELSMTTVVVIVLAMSMLILGLVLIRSIFKGATESVNILNDKVKGEITNLFTEEGSGMVAIKLGADKTANVPIGTDFFGLGIGAKTKDGSEVGNRSRMKYRLTIAEGNCGIDSLGAPLIKSVFLTTVQTTAATSQSDTTWMDFDEYSGANAFAIIRLKVPSTMKICNQKINVDVIDTGVTTSVTPGITTYAQEGSFFIVNIVRSGVFG